MPDDASQAEALRWYVLDELRARMARARTRGEPGSYIAGLRDAMEVVERHYAGLPEGGEG